MTSKTPALTRVPAMKLPEEVRFALNSASRHLQRLSHVLDTKIPEILRDASRSGGGWVSGIPRVRQEAIPEAESEIRSFLWELVHSFDLLLQHVNQDLALGLAEDKVTWATISGTATKQQKSSPELIALRSINGGASWFEEMKEYRNFAHRGQLMLLASVGENGVNSSKLAPIAPGARQWTDVPKELLGYLTATQNFMNGLGFWP